MQCTEKAPQSMTATEGQQRMDAKNNQSIDCPSLDVKPLDAFKEAIRNAGLPCPNQLIPDGQLHRFPTNGNDSDKAGYYALFDNGSGHYGGFFGCWRSGLEKTWKSASDDLLTDQERDKINQRIERKRKEAQEARQKARHEAKQKAQEEYESAKPTQDHPYLSAKGVGAHGMLPLRVNTKGNLLVPVHDMDGHIHSLQEITPAGDKYFLKDGATKGMFYVIDGKQDQIVIAEGYATAASIHEATGATVIVAFNAGNLKAVVNQIKQVYSDKTLLIAADNDRWSSLPDGRVNPGLIKAQEAAKAVHGHVICPEFKQEHLKGKPKDFNDLAQLEGLEAVKKAFNEQVKSSKVWDNPVDLASLINIEPPPIKWFATDNIPLGRGIIITGIGGSSKTRLIYQLAIGTACGSVPWGWEIAARGKSVLVLTEDIQEDVHRTLYYTCKSFRLSQAELEAVYNSILIYPLAGSDVQLLTTNKENTVVKTELFFALEQKIKSLEGVVFVGLDPALSLTTGDEMDQGHQRALGKMADDLAVNTGATVALVTHATKNSMNQEELSSHMSRGGSGITDAARGEFGMRTMTAQEASRAGIADIEERKRHVQLVGTKGNMLPPAAYVPVWLRRDQYGTLIGADISLDQGRGQPTQRDMKVRNVLIEMSKRHTPTLKEWREECVKQGLISGKTDNAVQQSMKRSLERLKKSGLIEQGHGKGIWRPICD